MTLEKNLLFHNSKAVVIDDSPTNRKVMQLGLEKYGASVTSFSNGNDLLGYVFNNKVDILILDIQMPELDGNSICKIIKSSHLNFPIVCWTASEISNEYTNATTDMPWKEKYLELGFSECLSKPFNSKELEELLIRTMPAHCFFDGLFFDYDKNYATTDTTEKNLVIQTMKNEIESDILILDNLLSCEDQKKITNIIFKICGAVGGAGYVTISDFLKLLGKTDNICYPSNRYLVLTLKRFISSIVGEL